MSARTQLLIQPSRPCPLCGARAAHADLQVRRHATDGRAYQLLRCATCTLRYTDAVPSAVECEALYDEDYYTDTPSGRRGRTWWRTGFQQALYRQRLGVFPSQNHGRLLEVGCGTGDFLAWLMRQGWEVSGTEISTAACRLAQQRGVPVFQGDVAVSGFPERSFDVIGLWHVLEHLPEPRQTLHALHRFLREDGWIVLEVPNSASPSSRLFGEAWYPLDVPRHVQHFTPSTLESLLQRTGFTVVRRLNFHFWDVPFVAYSTMRVMGILDALRIRSFSGDYQRAGWWRKTLFLLCAMPLGFVAALYTVLTVICSRQGETMTVVAKKTSGVSAAVAMTHPPSVVEATIDA